MGRDWIMPLAFGVLALTPAVAQQAPPRPQSAAEVLRNSQQSAGDVEQLRAGLHSPDSSVRVATFTAMANSDNPSLISVAVNEAHASSDSALQDLAARSAFRELRTFIVEPNGDVSPDMQSAFVAFSNSNGLQAQVKKYDWGSGEFEIFAGRGQISGSRLSFRSFFCQGSLASVQGTWTYEGLVVCANGPLKMTGKMHVSIR